MKTNNLLMPTLKYSVVMEKGEDGVFVADVPALPGCHTQGDTIEETERNIKEAIELYIEVLKDQGKPIPQPKFEELVEVNV